MGRTYSKQFTSKKSMSKTNPNYPSTTGNPSGKGRGNTPKSGGKGGAKKGGK